MNENEKFEQLLPIGSIVLLKEARKKLMIMAILQAQKEKVFDYMGVLYPEGYMDPKHCYLFNHENIAEVVWRGYEDAERSNFLELLKTTYEIEKSLLEENTGTENNG